MKRRVIQIANSTKLISLPMAWAKEHDINKGDELDVEPSYGKLIISPGQTTETKHIDIDITRLDRTSMLYVIRALYRRGFDQINITFNNPLTLHYRTKKKMRVASVIYDEVSRLIGLEIIKQTENLCQMKCISECSPSEFDGILRRIFLLLQDLYEDLVNGIDKNDIILLETIHNKHFTISKFVSYCLRSLNKHGYVDASKTTFFYFDLMALDRLADFCKFAARDILQYGKECSPETKKLLKKFRLAYDLYFGFFYNFSFERATEITNLRDTLKPELSKLPEGIPTQEKRMLFRMEQTLDLFLFMIETRACTVDFSSVSGNSA